MAETVANFDTSTTFMSHRSKAYKSTSEQTPEALAFLCNFTRDNGPVLLDDREDTILHLLATNGNKIALESLSRAGLLSDDLLMRKNAHGNIALHEAARFGHREVAEIMMSRKPELVLERNNVDETPLYIAAEYGQKDVFQVLEGKSDCMMRRRDGRTILHAAIDGERYCLAVSILDAYPDLGCKFDHNGWTPLNLLITKASSFKSKSPYVFYDLCRTSFVSWQLFIAIIYYFIPPMYLVAISESNAAGNEEDPRDNKADFTKLERSFITKTILGCFLLKYIDDTKQKHTLALELAKRLIEKEDWSRYVYLRSRDSKVSSSSPKMNPIIQATKLGILELVMAILGKCPEAADSCDENGRNILHISVEQKHRFVYDYLMSSLDFKNRMLADVDSQGNTILHLATCRRGSPNPTNQLAIDGNGGQSNEPFHSGEEGESLAALTQMSWDVLWFKRVKNDTYPHLWYHRNSNGNLAEELFERNHSTLLRKAENAAKNVSSNGVVLTVLLGTINFAALFTLPGGFDEDTGLPILFKTNKPELEFFMVYLLVALFFTAIALVALLMVPYSRFESKDFYLAIPMKLAVSQTCIVYCTYFTIAAFGQGYILEGQVAAVGSAVIFFAAVSGVLVVFIALELMILWFDYMYYVIRHCLAYRSLKM